MSKFPSSFLLTDIMKYFSNTKESMKLLDEIIIPYAGKEMDMLNLDENQPALLIIDAFSGQMTKAIIDKMAENYIKLVKVTSRITQFFQPLDFTVNGSAREFMKNHCSEWNRRCIGQELDNGKDIDSINNQLKMSILKPLHAQWIINLYNCLISSEGRKITSNG